MKRIIFFGIALVTLAVLMGGQAYAATKPPKPTGLAAVAESPTRIYLHWDPMPESIFKIYVSLSSGTEVEYSSSNVAYYYLDNLTPGTKYFFKVSAINAGGESSLSDEAAATTSTATSPAGNFGTATSGNTPPAPSGVNAAELNTITTGTGSQAEPVFPSVDIPEPDQNNGYFIPCGNPGQDACEFKHILELISKVINFIFVMVVPLCAVAVAWGGWSIMWGQGNPAKLTEAKNRMLKIFLGIACVMLAWIIVATILRTLGVDSAYVLLEL